MNDMVFKSNGRVVWRRGEYAGEQIYCTHCGCPVYWLTKRDIADGAIEEWGNLNHIRSSTKDDLAHLIDSSGNDIGRCKL